MKFPAASALPSYDEALARVLRFVPALGAQRVALDEALGRVLREDVTADRDQPPFNRSAVDGFAVISAAVRPATSYVVAGKIAAGAKPPHRATTSPGDVIRVATGAAVPVAFDAIIPIEQATVARKARAAADDAGAARRARHRSDAPADC